MDDYGQWISLRLYDDSTENSIFKNGYTDHWLIRYLIMTLGLATTIGHGWWCMTSRPSFFLHRFSVYVQVLSSWQHWYSALVITIIVHYPCAGFDSRLLNKFTPIDRLLDVMCVMQWFNSDRLEGKFYVSRWLFASESMWYDSIKPRNLGLIFFFQRAEFFLIS